MNVSQYLRLCMLLVMFWLTAGCNLNNPFRPEIITSLRFSPDAFDSYKRNTSIRFALTRRATVSAWITNSGGEVIIQLAEEFEQTRGTHSLAWLGLDLNGTFVTPGVYIAWVSADYDRASASVVVYHL